MIKAHISSYRSRSVTQNHLYSRNRARGHPSLSSWPIGLLYVHVASFACCRRSLVITKRECRLPPPLTHCIISKFEGKKKADLSKPLAAVRIWQIPTSTTQVFSSACNLVASRLDFSFALANNSTTRKVRRKKEKERDQEENKLKECQRRRTPTLCPATFFL